MVPSEKLLPRVGVAAFFLGLLVSVLAGFISPNSGDVAFVLGLLGILVGLLNISERKLHPYLLSNVAFLLAASSLEALLSQDVYLQIGTLLIPVVNYLITFIAPGAAIVALRALYDVAKE